MKQITVVAAAIIDPQRRVLAARRAAPSHSAGMWEFPGGKVEPGETDSQALIRECREELSVTVEPGERLGTDIVIGGGSTVLRVWLATISSGTPQLIDHTELRWLASDELDTVRWLPADAPLVNELRSRLTAQ